ncbi:hypothetical protein [Streptomyces sp. NPDC019539]|uniref:hypothetical protein n=1 Tax=Streptomyces sp. NPDC019539 TaxID=3365063 RepID=UPI00379BE8A0
MAFTREGLVNKVPVQMGTLRATYQAARALTASGQPEKAPQWLTDELVRLGSDPELDAADEIPLAMVCHRLQLDCGSRADKGTQRIGRLRVPEQLVPGNERLWQDAMTARAEFQMGCPRTQVRRENLPYGTSSPQFLMILRTLGESDCTTQVQELARGIDLVALARDTLKKGEIVQGSDALQAAIAAGRVIPQRMWQEMPDLVNNNRAPEGRDLFSKFAGGPASSQATAAGYYLLA